MIIRAKNLSRLVGKFGGIQKTNKNGTTLPPFIPWTPEELTTTIWVDADDASTITEVSGDVSQIDDKSGNDRHLANGVGSKQPTLGIINGLTAIDFFEDKALFIEGMTGCVTAFIITVIKYDGSATTNYHAMLDARAYAERMGAMRDNANGHGNAFHDDIEPTDVWVNGESLIPSRYDIDVVTYGAGSNDWPLDIINPQIVAVTTNPTRGAGTPGVTENDGFTIGNIDNATFGGDAMQGEVIALPSIPSESDRQKLEGYLAWKWGLQCNLIADHPYRFDGTLFGFGKLWQPSEITTELWLDAADASTITEAGGDISQWDDKSGNGNDAVQATGSAQPSYVAAGQNGLNVLRLDGMEYMTVDHGVVPDNDEASMVFIVAKGTDADEGMISNGNFAQNKSYSFATANASTDMVFWGGGASPLTQIYTLNTTFEDMSMHEIAISMTDTRIDLYQDGDLVHTDTSFTESVANDGTQEGVIGATQFLDDEDLNGDMCEVIVLKQEPDIITRQKMEGYLAWKWGLQESLPVGHPFKLVCPLADTNYAFTIDGIVVVDGLPIILV